MTRAVQRLAIACCLTLGLVPSVHADARPASDAGIEKIDFPRLLALSQHNARARAANYSTRAAQARTKEAKGLRYPKLSLDAFLAPSPDIRCVDALCTETNNNNDDVAFIIDGAYGGVTLDAVQPLFTFGKISGAIAAARGAARAAQHLENAVAGDQALDAAKAYFGAKLALELKWMLEDGDDQIGKALVMLDEKLDAGEGDVTVQDKLRVETLRSEVRARQTEAESAETEAIAAVRALAGRENVAPNDTPLEASPFDLLGSADEFVRRAQDQRPELAAIRAGHEAAKQVASLEGKRFLPDLAIAARLGFARATGVDEPPSAFARDPYNNLQAGLGLVLRWDLDPAVQWARRERRIEDARRAGALVEVAGAVASLEVKRAYAQAKFAKKRMEATRAGEKSARGWLAAVLQADAVGTAEAKDLADAYVAFFGTHARLLQAIYDWNVAVVALRRASGEFSAGADP